MSVRVRKHSLTFGILVAFVCLLAGTKANAQGADLINAAGNGDLPRVKVLLDTGADVNAKGRDGATALMAASEHGHGDVVDALLARGADVQAKGKDNGHRDVDQALLDTGADVKPRTLGGATALFLASAIGSSDVVEALLDKGAAVDARLDNGATALTLAKDDEVRALLIQAGAKR